MTAAFWTMPASAIWSCEAHGNTVVSAARWFARLYWQESRKLRRKPDAEGRFSVVGGVATYRVVLVQANRDRPAIFAIERE